MMQSLLFLPIDIFSILTTYLTGPEVDSLYETGNSHVRFLLTRCVEILANAKIDTCTRYPRIRELEVEYGDLTVLKTLTELKSLSISGMTTKIFRKDMDLGGPYTVLSDGNTIPLHRYTLPSSRLTPDSVISKRRVLEKWDSIPPTVDALKFDGYVPYTQLQNIPSNIKNLTLEEISGRYNVLTYICNLSPTLKSLKCFHVIDPYMHFHSDTLEELTVEREVRISDCKNLRELNCRSAHHADDDYFVERCPRLEKLVLNENIPSNLKLPPTIRSVTVQGQEMDIKQYRIVI